MGAIALGGKERFLPRAPTAGFGFFEEPGEVRGEIFFGDAVVSCGVEEEDAGDEVEEFPGAESDAHGGEQEVALEREVEPMRG